jgi:hypothetical protein
MASLRGSFFLEHIEQNLKGRFHATTRRRDENQNHEQGVALGFSFTGEVKLVRKYHQCILTEANRLA